jgi:hypothetical protein
MFGHRRRSFIASPQGDFIGLMTAVSFMLGNGCNTDDYFPTEIPLSNITVF